MFKKIQNLRYNKAYYQKASLVLEILPIVIENEAFALHGGTAINFFLFDDLYRLSIDIDLKYLTHENYTKAKNNIFHHLSMIQETLNARGYQTLREDGKLRTYVKKRDIEVFIDTSIESREAIGELINLPINHVVANEFDIKPFNVRIILDWQIIGSKLLTCLERQKARDTFDAHVFLNKGHVTEKIKEAIFRNLIFSRSSIFNALNPFRKIRKENLKVQFTGMSRHHFDYDLCRESILNTAKKYINPLMIQIKNF